MPSILMAHPGAELYGSDRVLLDSARTLVDRGWEVTVALPGRGPLHDELRAAGIRTLVTPMAVLRKSTLNPKGLVGLALGVLRSTPAQVRTIRSGRYDVVYVSTTIIPTWIVASRLARRAVVCHVHEAETAAPAIIRSLLAAPLLGTDRAVFNSRFCRSAVTGSLPACPDLGDVILNPIHGPDLVVAAREEATPPIRLLYVGRLSERKGPQLAVQAVEELRDAGVEVRLELLGTTFRGNEQFEEGLRADIARRGLEDHVELSGFVADVWPALRRCDAVVVPSLLDDSFGNTAVEAVLAARPVVVSDAGGLPEAVGDFRCARTFHVGDVRALTDAVLDVLSDWQRIRDLAVHDAAVAAERHGTGRYGEELDRVLRSVAERREAARRRRTRT